MLSLSVQISNRITISGLPYKDTVYSSGEEETWEHRFEVINSWMGLSFGVLVIT